MTIGNNDEGGLREKDTKSHSRLLTKKCDIEGRVFVIELLAMSNGYFASISEAPAPKIGAISVSMKSQHGTASSSLLPDRRGSIFAGMVGELLAEKSKGIAVTSLSLREELDTASMKMLLNELRQLAP